MKDENKTKKQLTIELHALRARIAELERIRMQHEEMLNGCNGTNEPYPLSASFFSDAQYVIFDRQLEFVNQGFESLFGYSKDEIYQPAFELMRLVAPASRESVQKIFRDGVRGDRAACQFEFIGLHKDGRMFECNTSVIFIPYKWGMAIHGRVWDTSLVKSADRSWPRTDRIEAAMVL
jgi:PAS domain S-box-containing protein